VETWRDLIYPVGPDEFGRKRGVPFKMASQVSAALHVVKEMKQRLRPKGMKAARKKL
jgi:hypothetical protein